MESKNIFKANIIVSELDDFFEELDEETEERFLNILNKENFSLADGEISCNAWNIDSDEAFFCNLIRTYEQKENLFDENICYEMIDNFSREYNMNLYKNDDSKSTKEIIFKAKKEVWGQYAKFLKDLAWWRFHPCKFETQEQRELYFQITEIYDEYCFDDGEFKNNLKYDKTAYCEVGVINDERVEMIKLINAAKRILSEFKELFKKTPSGNVNELLEKAESLLKNNAENKIFIDNDINFNYIFDNEIAPFSRNKKAREIF